MLNTLIRLSLRHRGPVLLVSLVALVYGGYLTTVQPVDVFPDLDRPRVVLLTECPGLSPEEVEALVAQPIETAILGAPGVEAVRSQSSQGLAVTYVEFGWETEVRYARQTVQERLTNLTGGLPPGVVPRMTPPASIMGQIIHVGLYRRTGPAGGSLAAVGRTGLMAERVDGDEPRLHVWRPAARDDYAGWEPVSAEAVVWADRAATFRVGDATHTVTFRTAAEQRMDLRTTADWVVRPRLLKEQGVAEVIVLGGDRKQYQVLIDPEKLLDLGVTIQDVDRAIRENNLNASGGFTEEGQTERAVRVIGRLGPQPEKVLDDLRRVPVKANGRRPVLLGQVATVVEGPAPKRGDAGMDGGDAVIVTVVKQPHADTRAVTDRVKKAVREAEATMAPDLAVQTELFQLKDFIDRGVYYVGEALVLGAGLVVVVLFLFLLNFRTTFITLTAIPLSLAVTAVVFRLVGAVTGQELSINVMTLGGIAVAMGELVDDAIVDVENIFRRLRENSASSEPRPALAVIYDASREIRSAVVFGTAVVILAFLPLFALSGVEGRLFVPLGLAYIVSILASLVVSLTVTPVLSYYLLPQSRAAHRTDDGPLLRGLKWGATYLIRFSMNRAGVLLLLTWALVGLCAWKLSTMGTDFLPKFDEGSVQINVTLPTGSSLPASNDAAAMIDGRLRAMQAAGEVRHFVRRTGRAELDEHAEPVSRSEYILAMNPDASRPRQEVLAGLLADLRAEVPGVEFEAEQPLAHLISHMLSGVTAEVAIKIHGDDLDQLQRLAARVKGAIADVPGLTPPVIDPQETVDELHIVLRPDDLAEYGLSREYVADFVETAMKGEVISQVVEGQRRFDLVVKLQAQHRTDYQRLRELRIDLPGGTGQIRLGDVADLPSAASGPNQINRENLRRRAVIRCNTSGRDLGSVVADIEKRVAQVPMPEGYFVELGGQFEAQREATRRIGVLAAVSVVGIFLVLYLLCPSARITLQILNAIPTAFIGGVIALAITGQTLTVASLVGFVSLGGIAVRNGILLVTHYLHLMAEEGQPFDRATVLRGSLERLSPVLMTALTAGLALLPIVVGGNKPGLEILYPVATVILGGLATSTFCEFLIHPGLFWQFSGKDAATLSTKGPK
ncbi:MAG TPA: efflux RND transporter permease subunit [Gemmataceae bacterium]|nr:efflux RND transporter permease subunit [Gemmataceae bacterium]